MTTNQTIDGVPRDLLERAAECMEQANYGTNWARELRALLDAPAVSLADEGEMPAAQPQPDPVLCKFYDVLDWPGLVRELVGHVTQLQDSAKRNVKPWEDTFPPTLLPAYIQRVNADNAAVQQPAPVAMVPDGYCIMPRQLTAENGAKALLLGEFRLLVTKECPECCELEEPAEGCSICDGEGEFGQKHTIPWDQIKFIYSKAVAGLALKAEPDKSR